MEIIDFPYDEKRTLNPASVFSDMSLKYSDNKYKVLRSKWKVLNVIGFGLYI